MTSNVPASQVGWPTFTPDLKYIRPATRLHKTILTIDGGGLRGMLPARLLEELEVIIKETLVLRNVRDKDNNLPPADMKFNIDLADYFDVVSGTSTGSIIATYIATKGELAVPFLQSDTSIRDLGANTGDFRPAGKAANAQKRIQSRYTPENLRPGGCRALQSVFAAKATRIFPRDAPKGYFLDRLGSLIQMGEDAMKCKYPYSGINETLKYAFGGPGSNPKELLKPSDTDERLSSSHIYTSLVIPAFHLEKTRTMIFYSRNDPNSEKGRSYGYATLNRSTSGVEKKKAQEKSAKDYAKIQQELSSRHLGSASPAIVLVPGVNFNLWEVVRSSTAAPTYFPSITLKPLVPDAWEKEDDLEGLNPANPTPWTLVDGGLTANDPGVAAITFATTAFPTVRNLDQLAVLSLGCGQTIASTDVKPNAGQLSWVGNLINCLMSGNQELCSAVLDHFLSRKYANTAEALETLDRTDRYVRIQKSAYASSDKKKKPPQSDTMNTIDQNIITGDTEISVGKVTKTVAELLADMDFADSVLHYVELAERMLEEPDVDEDEVGPDGKPFDNSVRAKFRRFAEDYLVPDIPELLGLRTKRELEQYNLTLNWIGVKPSPTVPIKS